MDTSIRNANGPTEYVWDPVVRTFHWLLVLSFAVAYVSVDDWFYLHLAAGYGVLLLITARCFWGFAGSRHARFSDFLFSPSSVWLHLRDLMRGRGHHHVGHNPAGAAMIFWLLTILFLLAMSGMGLYAVEDQAGPLAPWLAALDERYGPILTQVHELLVNLILMSVAAHVAGVVVESFLQRQNLVRAMVTGCKTIKGVPDNPAPEGGPPNADRPAAAADSPTRLDSLARTECRDRHNQNYSFLGGQNET